MIIKSLKNRLRSNKSEWLSVLSPAILISSILFLFGPFIIYSGNISEFQVSLIDILKYYAIPGIILVALIFIIGMLLSRNLLSLFVSIILTIGVLLWIQGNLFVWQNGPIGITDIDWTKNVWRGWVDATLWLALLAFVCVFHRMLSKIAVLVSIVFISIQIAYLAFLSVQNPEVWKVTEKSILPNSPPEKIFQFSSKLNIIHIILDEFQSTVFKDIIDEDPEYYKKALNGFTFFEQATGSFPTTLMSIPAILTGRTYKNDVPIDHFLGAVYKSRTISNVLVANGYEVDFAVPLSWYCIGEHSNCYQIPVPYGLSEEQHDQSNAVIMLNLVLFRYAPHFLKRAVLNNQIRLPGIDLTKADRRHWEAARHFAHQAFLQDLIENMSASRNGPVYKLIHLTTTHWPAVLNRDCLYAGKILPWTWENIMVQTRCCFDRFLGFLNKLKSIGIYESSFIILHADHGYWKIPDSATQIELRNEGQHLDGYSTDGKEYFAKIVCSALPLLAIKRPHSQGPLIISEVEAMLTDIPATISDVLNLDEKFNGCSVFRIGRNEVRKRIFRYYDKLNRAGDDYFDCMDEFAIKGNPLDKASWEFIKHVSPLQTYQTSKIDFGTNRASHFLHAGWSGNNGSSTEGVTCQWALGRSASIFLSLPKNERMSLTANVKTFLKSQHITIKVNGKKVGSWDISPSWHWEKHSVTIGADKDRSDVSVIEFMFSQHRNPEGKDLRPLAVLFESITLQKLESVK